MADILIMHEKTITNYDDNFPPHRMLFLDESKGKVVPVVV